MGRGPIRLPPRPCSEAYAASDGCVQPALDSPDEALLQHLVQVHRDAAVGLARPPAGVQRVDDLLDAQGRAGVAEYRGAGPRLAQAGEVVALLEGVAAPDLPDGRHPRLAAAPQ